MMVLCQFDFEFRLLRTCMSMRLPKMAVAMLGIVLSASAISTDPILPGHSSGPTSFFAVEDMK
jgi:hypothetical protein